MSRIPELERHQLSPEQTKVYDAVLASRGSLHGPFRAWLHSPEFAERAQRLGELARYQTSFDRRLSELAILVTARFWDAQLEWSIHEPPALEAGLSADTIDSIRRRETPSFELSDERAVYLYTHELLHEHFVSDEVFAAALGHVEQRGITELTLLIGYYTLVAFSLNAFQIETPADVKPSLPDALGKAGNVAQER
ncbi:MAG: carboxymuconolactone decarboxylase family protein [Acidobacteria bacterium]|nr:MAG: carboxymuconolactone decarboxylase family protein [Acidobacteriota bacterium]